ncbi:hypothetical protein VPHD518_0109 [Vibrio phage D518]
MKFLEREPLIIGNFLGTVNETPFRITTLNEIVISCRGNYSKVSELLGINRATTRKFAECGDAQLVKITGSEESPIYTLYARRGG